MTFLRADGPDKVSGSGRYTADLSFTGMAHAKFRYAEVSRGVIRSIDTSAARAMPGVYAVITAEDLDARFPTPIADRNLFAHQMVRFEGEVLAAVAAVDPETAEAAAAAIEVDIEPLTPVVDLAGAATAEPIHAEWRSYDAPEGIIRDGNVAAFSAVTKGDVEAGIQAAHLVVTSRYVADASHAVPIEPRAVVAQWEGDKVTVWTSSQVPFDARNGLATVLGMPTNRVRVVVPHLGGGFGGKCGFHFEAHVAALARAAQRPVKLVFSRWEEFIAPDRRREGMIIEITTGVSTDGEITARRATVTLDNGAYSADAEFFAQLAAMHLAGPYKLPAVDVKAELVYTNHQPSGSVRAPTAPQACWALESHTDELAAAVSIDPVEFRRRNLVGQGDEGPVGQIYEHIAPSECLERAVTAAELACVDNPLDSDEALGVAVGWWPSFAVPAGAFMKMSDDGRVQVITGAQECGTGSVMTLRNMAAEVLGIASDEVELIYQDTAVAPVGPGATGSQTLLNHGWAVENAARVIADQLKELAAIELEAAAADIVLASGAASVRGTPSVSVPIAQLAATAAEGRLLLASGSAPEREYPTVNASNCVGDAGMGSWLAPQFSCHVARVQLDRDTGVCRVRAVYAAHDSGRIINPIGAHGQVEGGIVMGVGQALTEGTQYDQEGRQRNPDLLHYKLTTAADAPRIHTEFVEIDTPNAGPRGSKGLAEAPNVATAGAISNALARLIGASVRQLPMTAERVWEQIQAHNQEVGQ